MRDFGMKHDFTSSGLILENDKVLLLFHRKLQCWIYPGGHVEQDEDPIRAVEREVLEETGLVVNVVGARDEELDVAGVSSLPLPIAILKEPINDNKQGQHIHIDLIYECKIIRVSAP